MTTLKVRVIETKTSKPISHAKVVVTEFGDKSRVTQTYKEELQDWTDWTGTDGQVAFELEPGTGTTYNLKVTAFNYTSPPQDVTLDETETDREITLRHQLGFQLEARNAEGQLVKRCMVGDIITVAATVQRGEIASYQWLLDKGELLGDATGEKVYWDTTDAAGTQQISCTIYDENDGALSTEMSMMILPELPSQITMAEPLQVSLSRARVDPSLDQALGIAIRTAESRISFWRYNEFIDQVLCQRPNVPSELPGRNPGGTRKLLRQGNELYAPVYGMGAYELLKTATEVFLLLNSGVFINREDFNEVDEESRLGRELLLSQVEQDLTAYMGGSDRPYRLPYIRRILLAAFPDCGDNNTIFCGGFLEDRSLGRGTLLMELIWTYWHKEAMVSQAMKAISLRFQNRRRANGPDPLAHLEIAPLHPINNLLWGYIQDEPHRLSERRIAHELMHAYGLAHTFSDLRPADTRSKFLGAFHHLLNQTIQFYRQDDDTTVKADAFPLLNALREVHLLLAEGNHNQSSELTFASRAEMLIEQWILARPELREFLQSRAMVPYREPWMGAVDTMKRLQGWTDIGVTHFNELAVFGEQVLLSIRYGDWVDVNNPVQAANWARDWRPEILSIVHATRAVTGVELRADVTTPQQRDLLTAQPSMLINRRSPLTMLPALPPGQSTDGLPRFRQRRALRRQLRP
jgi:hypothetical protein